MQKKNTIESNWKSYLKTLAWSESDCTLKLGVSSLIKNISTTRRSNLLLHASIHSNQIPLSRNRLNLSPWSFKHVFKKIETIMRWNCMSKALRFLQVTDEHQDCPFFTAFLTIKTFSPQKIYSSTTSFWDSSRISSRYKDITAMFATESITVKDHADNLQI